MIPVTKPYLPERARFDRYLDGIFERQCLTNNGPLVKELTTRLEQHLGVENLLLVSNGTLALQIAFRVLVPQRRIVSDANALTTPFTFVATASSLEWEGLRPKFADIECDTWCMSPSLAAPLAGSSTAAIIPVHVFGNACDVESFSDLAAGHKLPLIFDASHAFGVLWKGKSILSWGDASTLSFHATKLFHTMEGGAIVFRNPEHLEEARRLINFGIVEPDRIQGPGINAKMSEMQAAMGLAVLDEMTANTERRSSIWHRYQSAFESTNKIQLQIRSDSASNNYAYFPILLATEKDALRVLSLLEKNDIFARRYFYPSLNLLSHYDSDQKCDVSVSISRRILCLPIYSDLTIAHVDFIIEKIRSMDLKDSAATDLY